jgi:hypothetical protein
MGSIYDRRREHLGASDKAVIAVRRYLINAARRLREGDEPPHSHADASTSNPIHVDTIAKVIPSDGDWHRHFPHLTYSAAAALSGEGRREGASDEPVAAG